MLNEPAPNTIIKNNRWKITAVRSAFAGHLSGRLINLKSGNRYVWQRLNGKVTYMKDPIIPRNIPRYISEVLEGVRMV